MTSKFYITTAIDYVNDTIHIGHVFQKLIADVLARHYRLKLGRDNVFFLTGTDEYGQKAEQAAAKAGISTQEFVNKVSKSDQEQQDALNISYDRFIRTTDPDHQKVAQEIWNRVNKTGDIYLGEYSGLYCSGCEAYYTKDDLVDGQCPYHPTLKIQEITEKNYFFKWSRYRDFLVEHINSHPEFVVPEERKKEMLEFAKNINDIPISRTNFKWGVPVPNDPNQIMYVWFDALINYLTGVGFLEDQDLFNKFWPADIHILGKDNARWHVLLWPAMLKSAGVELQHTVLVNGFLSLDGQKISKSIGNVIRPTDWVEKFGVDAVRYYLLRYTTVTEDGDVSEEKLIQAYNSDLANGLGNLVARVARLAEKHQLDVVQEDLKLDSKVEKSLESFKLNESLKIIWELIADADRKVNETKPWELEDAAAVEVLIDLVERIQVIAYNLQPFLPNTAEKILKQFSGRIKSAEGLFPRI